MGKHERDDGEQSGMARTVAADLTKRAVDHSLLKGHEKQKESSRTPLSRRRILVAVTVLGMIVLMAMALRRRRAAHDDQTQQDERSEDTGQDDPKEMIDLTDAAERLNVPTEQIEVMVAEGLLLPADGGAPLRFVLAEVEAVRLQGG